MINGVQQIAIIGLGMMGSSLALALKSNQFSGTILGYSRNQDICDIAIKNKLCDEASSDYREIVRNADLIIMCLPVNLIIKKVEEIIPYLKNNAVITDIGSTKYSIMESVEKIIKNSNVWFIGSHPICGSEKKGFHSAQADLFKGKKTVVCNQFNVPDNLLNSVIELWNIVGCDVIQMSPEEHDKLLAATSHLPHILSAIMVHVIQMNNDNNSKKIYDLCGSGFSDISRLAAGSPDIWVDIIKTNKNSLLEQLKKVEEQLKIIQNIINDTDNLEDVYKWLNDAVKLRDDIISKSRL